MARPVAECEQSRLEQVEQFGRRLQTEQESMAVTFAEQIAGIEQSMAEKLRAHETFVQRELERRMDEAEVGRTALKWMSTVSELRSSLGAQKEALSQADSAQREARSQAEEGLAEMKRSLGLQRELQQQAQHELARAMHLRADIERWWSSQSEAASASGAASAKADKRPAAPAAPVPGPGAPAGPSEEVQKRLEVQSLKLKLLQAQVDTLMQATPVPAATALGSASDLLAQFQDCTNEDERRQLFEALLSQSSAALQPAAPMRPGGCSGQLSPGLSAQLSPLRSRPSSTGQLSSERLSPELSAQPSPVRSRPSSTGQLSSERLSPGHPRGREEPAQAAGPGAPGPSPLPEWAPLPSAARASAGASPPQGQRSGGSLGAGALRAPAPRGGGELGPRRRLQQHEPPAAAEPGSRGAWPCGAAGLFYRARVTAGRLLHAGAPHAPAACRCMGRAAHGCAMAGVQRALWSSRQGPWRTGARRAIHPVWGAAGAPSAGEFRENAGSFSSRARVIGPGSCGFLPVSLPENLLPPFSLMHGFAHVCRPMHSQKAQTSSDAT
ncbi:unnamed protein product [Prorocentrum cordatum]|uniref:Centrosomal protein POC5 n=1 Tax=Prorocentrum cordatum TaxID=2364126 RepID=A0ABN9VCY7_9DINO|nr:unnamed protein product [Polarella glacialis]